MTDVEHSTRSSDRAATDAEHCATGCEDATTNDGRLLLEFLQGRDMPCPACGYNLRDLPSPVCPECREALRLQVGCQRARFGIFLAVLAPCIFSGICALFLLVPIVISRGNAPAGILALDAFGLSSGLAGLVLIRKREQFIRKSTADQWPCAGVLQPGG